MAPAREDLAGELLPWATPKNVLTCLLRWQSPPVVQGNILSWLGLSMGSSIQAVSDYFLDAAFMGSQVLRTLHRCDHVVELSNMQHGCKS